MPKPVAVVSGATGTIGQVVVRRLLQEGYGVLALGRRQEALTALYDQCRIDTGLMGGKAWSLYTMVADFRERTALLRFERQLGSCDLLVTCHGAPPCIKPTTELSPSDYDSVMDVDLHGTFELCQIVGDHMLTAGTGGNMVLLSSFHALGSYPQRCLYAMAKAGVCALARSLACEWAGAGIRVNAVAPGQIAGARTKAIAMTDEGTNILERMRQRAPAGRLVQAEDVAETVVWLTRTPGMNGQTVVLDHGVTASLYYENYEVKE